MYSPSQSPLPPSSLPHWSNFYLRVYLYFADNGLYSQSYGFSCSHVRMWQLGHKEGWASKNWCFWTLVLEKTLESPLDWKEIKPANPKRNQPWLLFGRTGAEAEASIFWPPDAKIWLIGKDPDGGKAWRQEEKGMTEEKSTRWLDGITGLNGHEFEQTLGDSEVQGNLACFSQWDGIELGTTEWLNDNKYLYTYTLVFNTFYIV